MKAETKLRHNFIFSKHLFGLPLGDALSSYRSDKRQNRKDVDRTRGTNGANQLINKSLEKRKTYDE